MRDENEEYSQLRTWLFIPNITWSEWINPVAGMKNAIKIIGQSLLERLTHWSTELEQILKTGVNMMNYKELAHDRD